MKNFARKRIKCKNEQNEQEWRQGGKLSKEAFDSRWNRNFWTGHDDDGPLSLITLCYLRTVRLWTRKKLFRRKCEWKESAGGSLICAQEIRIRAPIQDSCCSHLDIDNLYKKDRQKNVSRESSHLMTRLIMYKWMRIKRTSVVTRIINCVCSFIHSSFSDHRFNNYGVKNYSFLLKLSLTTTIILYLLFQTRTTWRTHISLLISHK